MSISSASPFEQNMLTVHSRTKPCGKHVLPEDSPDEIGAAIADRTTTAVRS